MNADGSNLASVAGSRGAANPAWSPTREEIAFDTSAGIVVSNPSGTSQRVIAASGRSEPAWSPEGNRIAFVRQAGSENRLVVANRFGGSSEVWYSTTASVESPTWDADGDAISFVRHGGDGQLGRTATQVWNVGSNGSAQRLFSSSEPLVHLARYTRRASECDFNGDGHSDLAIGLPGQDVDGSAKAGAVQILYGSPSGIDTSQTQQLHRGLDFVSGSPEPRARFGKALACGDFDSDRFSDLAIGAPGGAGSATIMYGSSNGLVTLGDLWSQGTAGVPGAPETGDAFGSALATGDFDGDGFVDLAVGSPQDIVAGRNAGTVNVFYGSKQGLRADGSQIWHQNSNNVRGKAHRNDQFGTSLASADFDGNGRDDLVVGAPRDLVSGIRAGAVSVLYGRRAGLRARGNQRWHQEIEGAAGTARPRNRYGQSLAAGDFGGDGDGDLAIGTPRDRVAGVRSGSVTVMYGQPTGLSVQYSDRYHSESTGIAGAADAGDRFGVALTAGDFDGDNRTDLAVGVAGDTAGGRSAGSVTVLFSQATGVETAGSQRWTQKTTGIAGEPGAGDRLGGALAVGDFNDDGFVDLVAGVPGETVAGFAKAGAVHVLFGSSRGPTAAGALLLHQGRAWVTGSLQSGDSFGSSAD